MWGVKGGATGNHWYYIDRVDASAAS
jgi:hypothetical protein